MTVERRGWLAGVMGGNYEHRLKISLSHQERGWKLMLLFLIAIFDRIDERDGVVCTVCILWSFGMCSPDARHH
jgi:hypothetical protein